MGVYYYNGESVSVLCDESINCQNPVLDGNIAAWDCEDGDDYEIYSYDGVETKRLTNNNKC